ncbi:MAG TPA: phenylalanine--tRNA ligase subunit beta, partial [Pyrinomonadaceae bacterium]|nr:phenylalanine--tRNA ligase subunit beta [Pyrinomonadaceae bacterium]
EVGVITGKRFKISTDPANDEIPDVPIPALLVVDTVKIEDTQLCNRFTARVIRNVKIGPSPDWLVRRLEAVGERSINNVADITNYVMLELGQPMHAFDLDKLEENRVVIRRARYGETIKTLDEVERKLEKSMLAICDATKPVAVAGVMGGFNSSIAESTTNVLLEVAYFDPESVRSTSRALNLSTEASYRFERGVDIENLRRASDRATELIAELAGGSPGQFVDLYPTPIPAIGVTSPDVAAAVSRLTGLSTPAAECERILDSLGIIRESVDRYSVPTWRHDISIEEDLVEEVARHSGYENIGQELPPAFLAGEYQASEMRMRRIRYDLAGLGFDEAITYSFIDGKFDDAIAPIPGLMNNEADAPFVTLRDSVIEGAVRMRPTLLPGLLNALRLNLNQQRRDIKLFEIGKVFAATPIAGELPAERSALALLVTGGEINAGRAAAVREVDFYDAKGALEAAADAAGLPQLTFDADNIKHLRRGQTASISIGKQAIGSIGRINEEIAADYKFKQPVYVAEIDLQAALGHASSSAVYAALSKYPAVIRDVSFVVGRDMAFASIRRAVADMNVELCRNMEFVDVYEGKGLSENERSVTVRLEYRSDERTLVEDEVNSAHEVLLRGLEERLNIRPRF